MLTPRLYPLGTGRFQRFANAEITIRQGSAQFDVDPETGDEVPRFSTTVLSCKLRRAKKDPKLMEERGTEVIRTRLKGLAIEPMLLPVDVKIGLVCNCRITDHASGMTSEGIFEFIEIVQSPLHQEWQGVIGNRFEGYFTESSEGLYSWP
jgi:hypothetical protein